MISTKKKQTISNTETLDVLDFFENYANDLSKETTFSKKMLNQNIATEFSKLVDDMLKNPLDTTYKTFKFTADNVAILLNEITVAFLKENKKNIYKIVLPFDNNPLIYNIILKKDSTHNRAEMLRYVMKYNNTPMASNFKIVFAFIPKEFENAIEGKELKLA